jgi:hypothetical protein
VAPPTHGGGTGPAAGQPRQRRQQRGCGKQGQQRCRHSPQCSKGQAWHWEGCVFPAAAGLHPSQRCRQQQQRESFFQQDPLHRVWVAATVSRATGRLHGMLLLPDKPAAAGSQPATASDPSHASMIMTPTYCSPPKDIRAFLSPTAPATAASAGRCVYLHISTSRLQRMPFVACGPLKAQPPVLTSLILIMQLAMLLPAAGAGGRGRRRAAGGAGGDPGGPRSPAHRHGAEPVSLLTLKGSGLQLRTFAMLPIGGDPGRPCAPAWCRTCESSEQHAESLAPLPVGGHAVITPAAELSIGRAFIQSQACP